MASQIAGRTGIAGLASPALRSIDNRRTAPGPGFMFVVRRPDRDVAITKLRPDMQEWANSRDYRLRVCPICARPSGAGRRCWLVHFGRRMSVVRNWVRWGLDVGHLFVDTCSTGSVWGRRCGGRSSTSARTVSVLSGWNTVRRWKRSCRQAAAWVCRCCVAYFVRRGKPRDVTHRRSGGNHSLALLPLR